MKILCICHANVCRSFMAQEFFKQLLPNVTVFSRGLYANPSYQVPLKVKQALATYHITDTRHTPQLLTPQDMYEADLIFCMEKKHEDLLLDRFAQYTDKIWLLTEFSGEKPTDVPDPIGLEGRRFAKQAKHLYQLVQACARRITQTHTGETI